MNGHPRRVYLASRSPRRRELLKQVGINFELLLFREDARRGLDVDESPHAGEDARDYVVRMARSKAEAASLRLVQRRLPAHPVLAADTTVVLDDQILGKPLDAAQAHAMLSRLSGRAHDVLTAIAVCRHDRLETRLSVSTVELAPLSPAQIRQYVASGEPLDKAGAYAIQGRAGAFVRHLSGSYTGVMGLPLYETVSLLETFGLAPP
ncbi:MAG: septum formation inhibitor Maf [Burkholderiales bacterium]|nr:septum formation inhibitor Maf [Burkholderiales bacterium]